MQHAAELALDCRCALAEGPVWWDECLWFVDIEGKNLHRFNPADGQHDHYPAGQRIGFAVPTNRPGHWIVGLEEGLATWNPTQEKPPEIFSRPEQGKERVIRFNDGKCDPTGRLYAGTMPLDGTRGSASLYRIDSGLQVARVVPDVTISNGLAWRPEKQAMYYIDTPTRRVDAFDWMAETGEIANRRPVHALEEGIGGPDGMCIDSAGHLWVAIWGGQRVRCIDPADGRVVTEVAVPANAITSCCFGDADLRTLYITTAGQGQPQAKRAEQPAAGGIFKVRLTTPGLPTTPFRIE